MFNDLDFNLWGEFYKDLVINISDEFNRKLKKVNIITDNFQKIVFKFMILLI